jgi:hypothetical protein
MQLIAPPKDRSFGRLEALVLGLYAVLVSTLCYFHEPWADEAQAWLIARDNSLSNILFTRLHYEGTPGLWHVLLWLLCRLHVSYAGMHWLTAGISVVAVYVLLRYSPFPLIIKILLTFTFPIAYQLPIVARSYSLLPLLLFLVCITMSPSRKRPVTWAVLVGLLANTSLFATLLAIGLALYQFSIWFRRNRKLSRKEHVSLLIAASFVLFALYTAVPAPDISVAIHDQMAPHPGISRFLSEITRITPEPGSTDPRNISHTDRIKPVSAETSPSRSLPKHLAHDVRALVSTWFYTISSANLIALLFSIALAFWLIERRMLLTLIPLAFLVIGGYKLGFNEHHIPVIFLGLVVSMWLSLSNGRDVNSRSQQAFLLILVLVLLEQVGWSVSATNFEIHNAFDAGKEVAAVAYPLTRAGGVANLSFSVTAAQPYFPGTLFVNQKTTYWPWKISEDSRKWVAKTLDLQPKYALDDSTSPGNATIQHQLSENFLYWTFPRQAIAREKTWNADYLASRKYVEVKRFCGKQPAQFGFSVEVCDVLYESETAHE